MGARAGCVCNIATCPGPVVVVRLPRVMLARDAKCRRRQRRATKKMTMMMMKKVKRKKQKTTADDTLGQMFVEWVNNLKRSLQINHAALNI